LSTTTYEQLIAFREKYDLADEILLRFVAGYGDVVASWLRESSPTRDLPMSFDEFLRAVEDAMTQSDTARP
jgi:hypothetical protein